MSEPDHKKAHNPKGNPAWRKGGPSANPHGRPRSGLAFADAVRRRLDPDKILDLLDRLLDDDDTPIKERLAAVLPYVHSGFLRPPTTTAAQINVSGSLSSGDRPFAELSIDELRARVAASKVALAVALPSPDPDAIPDDER